MKSQTLHPSFPTQLFLDGEWRDSRNGQRIPQINPATEDVFAEVSAASLADVDAAVDGAHRAFEQGWRDLAPGKRTEMLFHIARLLRENSETLAQLESRNVGKPISDARDEVPLGARVFEYYAGAMTKFFGQTIPVARGGFDFTLRQPHGRGGRDCAVEFSFPDRLLESGARVGRGKYRRAQAGQSIAAHRPIAGPIGAPGGVARRRAASVAGLRRADRRCAGHASARSQNLFHRLDGDWVPHHGTGRRAI